MTKTMLVEIETAKNKLRALKCGNKYGTDNRIWKGDIWDKAIEECIKELDLLKEQESAWKSIE